VAGKLVALIVPLGLDTFAVAAAIGMVGGSHRSRLRLSVVFVSFEALMPLLGLAAGAPIGRAIGSGGDYVAVGVLLAFGVYTLLGSEGDDEKKLATLAAVRGPGVLLLGLSISLDELAIGFTLGLLRLPVALIIGLIAIQALVVSQLGFRLGARLSERLREAAERLAGAALTGLAIALLAAKVF
jgi:putative Mn2+ efflux pump MntP